MQGLAALTGMETAFILPPTTAAAAFRLRFFTPTGEMDLCGHATIAALLHRSTVAISADTGVQVQTDRGMLSGGASGEHAWLRLMEPTYSHCPVSRRRLAAALGCEEAALHPTRTPEVASVGRAKVLIPMREQAELDGLSPVRELVRATCREADATGLYPYVVTSSTSNIIAARQFPEDAGFLEDPATAVAAGALGAALARGGTMASAYTVLQGQAMGRPSRISVSMSAGGALVEVSGRGQLSALRRLPLR